MSSQSRYADEIINSCDAIKECIQELPDVASLWILYQFAESFENFEDQEVVPFKDWLIQINQEQVEELEEELFGLTMGTTIEMKEEK